MPRPSPGDPYPYSRGDIQVLTGASVPTIKNLQRGRVLRKRSRGTGHHTGYNFDDAVRIIIAKQLLRLGLQVSSIQSLFEALETPPSTGKRWSWLRSAEAREQGAALVLIQGHPLGPDPAHVGHAYLTTADEARAWLMSERTVSVLDVGYLIRELEERSGERYEDQPATQERPRRGEQH